MIKHIIFKTPTRMDLKSITLFGVHDKPNADSPIGYFGTGLKYAVAVLLREDIDIELRINGSTYKFRKATSTFRSTELECIEIYSDNFVQQLPFTTALGKTWELWQAYRELESNTRDENGETIAVADVPELPGVDNAIEGGDTTEIIVTGDSFVEEYNQRGATFLDLPDENKIEISPGLNMYSEPSKYLYYRGLRVYTLGVPADLTYDIQYRVDLTEDRTLKYPGWDIKQCVQMITRSDHIAIMKKCLQSENSFESSFPWDRLDEPGEHFIQLLADLTAAKQQYSRRAHLYYNEHRKRVVPKIPMRALRLEEPRWRSFYVNTENSNNVHVQEFRGFIKEMLGD